MNVRRYCFRYCMVFLAAATALAFSPFNAEGQLTATSAVRLRETPSQRGRLLEILKAGTALNPLSSDSVRRGYLWVTTGTDTGWVAEKYVQAAALAGPTLRAMSATVGAVIESLDECPLTGSADDDPDGPNALSNSLKRTFPSNAQPKTLTFDDFERLQEDVGNIFNRDFHASKIKMKATDRAKLQGLQLDHGSVSEGDLIQISGYLIDPPAHANSSGESVNCKLKGTANNDFHITISDSPDRDKFSGIVVEMIPQDRRSSWTLARLKAVQASGRAVLVVGQLFFDMEHMVNDDAEDPNGTQPPRYSLFEVHPISKFFVCKKTTTCRTTRRADWDSF